MKTSKNSTPFKPGWLAKIGAVALVASLAAWNFNARATNIEWQGGNADYNTPANWAGGSVPGPADSAINDHGTNNAVQINSGDPDWTLNALLAGDGLGDGAYVQGGQNVNLTNTSRAFRLGVAADDTGVYTLNGGAINYGLGGFNVGEIGAGVLNLNGGTITGGGNFADNFGISAAAVNASMDGGLNLSGTTWFDQGFDTGNTALGLPVPGSELTTNLTGVNYTYIMASSYTTNDAVLVDSNVTATITLSSATALSGLSFLGSAGNGPATLNYTVNHADSSTESGTLVFLDWFNTAGPIVFGAGGRANADGTGITAYTAGSFPFLFAVNATLTNTTSPVTSVVLSFNSDTTGDSHVGIMALAGSTGGDFNPLGITAASYNANMILSPDATTVVDPSIVDVVNQTGGAIDVTNAGQMFVGNYGAGVYNLSAGSIDVHNYIAFGRSGGTGTFNMTGGALNQDGGGNILVGTGFGAPSGGSAVGVLNQSGGTITSQGQLLIPEQSPSTGTYNLSGTGSIVVNNWVAIGRNGGAGVLNMNGGSLTKGGDNTTHLDIGASATGVFNQTNGVVTNLVSGTWLGESSSGTWNLEGGAAYLGKLVICEDGSANGTMNLDGGLLQTTGIGTGSSVAFSTLNFNGATLQASANNATFISGLTIAEIEAGGAVIDSQGYSINIPQILTDAGGGNLTKLGTGTLTLSGANSYSGNTIVNAGTLITDTGSSASQSGSVTVADGAGFGVTVVNQGAQYVVANVNLGVSTGASLSFDVGPFGNPSVGQAPLDVTGTLALNGTTVVNVADGYPQVGEFPLIQYGTLAGTGNFVVGTLPVGVSASIVTNVPNSSIDLVIGGVNQPRWDGEAGGTWDTGSDTNWVNIGTGLPTTYTDPSPVVFNDSALGTTNVTITATVDPTSMLVTNNTLNYNFVGTGKIGGAAGLTKQGSASLSILNTGGNTYGGPTVISGGVLSVTNLANGGSPSAIGASSANPTNLVLAGGTFSYGGAPVAINRGYTMTASSTVDAEGNLALSGPIQATAGAYIKTGPGTLTYNDTGSNFLSIATGSFSAQVLNGTLTLDGSAGGQTNVAGGDMYVGSGTATGANLVLTNTTLNVNAWFAIGRGNGTSGLTSSVSMYNSSLSCPSGLSLGYANGLAGYQAVQFLNAYNSKIVTAGNVNICETANSGATSTVTLTGNSSISGGTAYVGASTSKGVLNLNSTGTSYLGNVSGGTFRVGGNATSTDTGVGAINQSAGTFISGSNGVYLALGVGSATSYGSYVLSGGTFSRPVTGVRVGRGGLASFVQSGGTFTDAAEFSLGSSGGFGATVAAATFTGGSANISTAQGFRVPESSTFTAGLNIGTEAGGNASVVALNTSPVQLCYSAGTGTGTLNLDSGTLQLGGPISKASGAGTGTVNLNGGTLQAGTSGINLLNNTPTSVNMFKGGLTVDSMANSATMTANILPTAGKGVYPAGGTITVPSSGGAGYIGAPLVTVTTSGSGTGLQAIANISSGTVTNVVITCPGQGYQAGDTVNFAFAGGGYTTAASTYAYVLQAGDVSANAGGGLTKIGTGALYLNGTNTYTGTNLVNAGTLAGTGSLAGSVTVASGGTLAAGSSTTTLGTNTIAGIVTFQFGSTNFVKVNKTTLGKDLLTGMSQVNFGGTLVISNQAGTFAAGDTFKLYNAAVYSGAFNAIVPATPGTGLAWNTSQLTVNGTLSVANGVNTNSAPIAFNLSGGNLNLSWPADHLGWRLLVQTNSLSTGLGTNWATWPNSASVTNVSIPITATNPAVFFQLIYP